MPSLIDLMLEGRQIQHHSPWPRSVVDAAVWNFAASELAQGRCSLLGLWGEPATVHMAIMDEQTAEIAVVSLDCPEPQLSFDRHASPAGASIGARRSTICLDWQRKARPIRAPGLITTVGACASRWEIASTRCRKRRPIAFCRRKATACTRSRSVPCMPESLSLDTSGLRQVGRPWSAWKSGWDIPTRASKGSWLGADLERAAQLAGRVSGDSTSRMLLPFREQSKPRWRSWCLIARFGYVLFLRNSSGLPTISATSERSATMPPLF